MGNKKVSPEDLLRRHKTLSKEDIKKAFKQQEAAKEKYEIDGSKLEENLDKFNEVLDPIVNPATDEALCWVRRPTQAELEEMIPSELMKYRNDPNGVPIEVITENEDMLFDMMAKLIKIPAHDTKWWKSHSNLVFQRLFQMHIQQVLHDLGIMVGNF